MASVVAMAVLVAAAVGGCGGDGSGTSSTSKKAAADPATETATSATDDGYIDPAQCFKDLGAVPVSSASDLSSVDPRNVTVDAAGTNRKGEHPIAFKNVHGEPFRLYAVAKPLAIATKKQILSHPERLPYVGFLEPPASAKAIKAGTDCLDGYRGL